MPDTQTTQKLAIHVRPWCDLDFTWPWLLRTLVSSNVSIAGCWVWNYWDRIGSEVEPAAANTSIYVQTLW